MKKSQATKVGTGVGASTMAGKSARSRVLEERKALNSYFTFNRKVGNRFNIAPQKNRYGTPGIFAMYYTPSFGFNNDAESEIQSAVNDLYKYVRSYQTANADYTAPDLMMYVLAAEQIFSWVAYLSRGFNAMQFSAYDNRYVPRVLTQACGFDYDDLKSKRTQFADHINYIIQTMCDYALPKQCSFSLRQEWMNSNVFMDAPDSCAQLYVLNPRTFLKLVENVDESNVVTYSLEEIAVNHPGSSTVYSYHGLVEAIVNRDTVSVSKPYSSDGITVNPIKLTLNLISNITEQLLSPFILMHMQDISGDIRHAFGDDNLRQWTPLMLGSDWTPIYDENALLQINNTTLIGFLDYKFNKLTENSTSEILLSNPCLYTSNNVRQDPLYGKVSTTSGKEFGPLNILQGDRILNMTVASPTPDEKLLATRWMNGVSYGTALLYPDTSKYRVYTAATEIFEFGVLYIYDYANGQELNTIIKRVGPYFTAETPGFYYNSSISSTSSDTARIDFTETLIAPWVEKLDWLASFSKHPIIYKTTQIIDTNSLGAWHGGGISYQFDINNWTPLTLDDVAHLSNVDLSMAFIIR